MGVRWTIDDKVRAELHFFTGLSFSGNRTVVRIFPGGRVQGPEVEGDRMKACAVSGPLGLRVVLCASDSETEWERMPWRALVLRAGTVVKSPSGQPAVQVPDLDRLDGFGARRVDPDVEEGFVIAPTLKEGTGWTFVGSDLSHELKCNVRQIRLDLI